MKYIITKKNVDYFEVPNELWQLIKHLIPKPPERKDHGRPGPYDRVTLNGIWYILWTGCQWKAIQRDWFGVCSM